jgi:Cu-processing system permease protein
MWPFFLASWRAGFRSRALLGSAFLGAGVVLTAYLAASFSMRQLQTVTLDVGLSGLRVCLVLISITLVQDLVAREVERRSVIFSICYPASRADYLLGRFFGVVALSFVSLLILALLLLSAVLFVGNGYEQQFGVSLGLPFWAAILGVWLDSLVVAAFAVLVCCVSTVSVLPLAAGLVFAIAGKALGPLVEYIADGANGQPELAAAYQPILSVAVWLIPDLSRLDWRAWPMYGLQPDPVTMLWSIVIALGYAGAMLAFAVGIFNRREFS